MQHYMIQASFTAETWTKLLDKPKGRRESLRAAIEKLGGTLDGLWLSFGDYDLVLLCSLPDNVSSAAFAMAASACGGLKSTKTTPLLAPEEGLVAMEKAYMENMSFLY